MKKKKIISFKKAKFKRNYVFLLLLLVVMAYFVWTVYQFRSSKQILSYEVREGSIYTDSTCTGFAIRNEEVIKSTESGYINFFVSDGSKVGLDTDVYTISKSALKLDEGTSNDPKKNGKSSLSTDEQTSLVFKFQEFETNYTTSNFNSVYAFKEDIQRNIAKKTNHTKKEHLRELASQDSSIKVLKSTKDGFLFYEIDGYESVTEENFDPKYLSESTSLSVDLQSNSQVKRGSEIYKLVSDNNWKIIISLNDTTSEYLKDRKRVRVKFLKDNQTETANIQLKEFNGQQYCILSFNKGMIRYASERFLDIDLITEDQTGLKIPKSAIVRKAFYTIPFDYIGPARDNEKQCVLVQKGKDVKEQAVNVYYHDEESDLVYLETSDFERNTVLRKRDSDQTVRLVKKKKLSGVYNINKGYAVFKQIKILAEGEEYVIIEAGNQYSLTNYDHIALNGEAIKENDVLY